MPQQRLGKPGGDFEILGLRCRALRPPDRGPFAIAGERQCLRRSRRQRRARQRAPRRARRAAGNTAIAARHPGAGRLPPAPPPKSARASREIKAFRPFLHPPLLLPRAGKTVNAKA